MGEAEEAGVGKRTPGSIRRMIIYLPTSNLSELYYRFSYYWALGGLPPPGAAIPLRVLGHVNRFMEKTIRPRKGPIAIRGTRERRG